MGKGDKKTRRGKIIRGSYGVLRKRKKAATNAPGPGKPVKEKSTVETPKPAKETKATRVKEEKTTETKKAEKTDKVKKGTAEKKSKPGEKVE